VTGDVNYTRNACKYPSVNQYGITLETSGCSHPSAFVCMKYVCSCFIFHIINTLFNNSDMCKLN
jgi:hypothetical protein